jgi:hypothetical protein
MTQTEQTVGGVFEATIEALSRFDLDRLLTLEEKMLRLARSGARVHLSPSLLERRNQLGRTLDETRNNLEVLQRLHSRKGEDPWER